MSGRREKDWGAIRFCFLLAAFAVCFLGGPAVCRAQPAAGNAGDEPVFQNGFHIYDATISGGFASIRGYQGALIGSGIQSFNGYSGWGSLSAGYVNHGPAGTFSITYTPSVTSLFKYSSYWFDQDLRLDVVRRLSPAWTFHLDGAASESTIEEFLFAPGETVNVGAADAGDAIYNPSLAQALQGLLVGTRILSFDGSAGLTYRPTPRFRLGMTAGGDKAQSRHDSTQPIQYLVPQTLSGQGDLTLGYNLTPQTEIGAEATALYSRSILGRYRAASGGAFFGRKLGPHWSVSAMGGLGEVGGVGMGSSTFLTYIASGTLTRQGLTSTVLLSYRRLAGDVYGFGSTSTGIYSASWNWHRRGRAWGLMAFGERQQLGGGGPTGGIDLWDASFGVTRALGRQVSMGLSGAYLTEAIPGFQTDQTNAYVARLTFSWIPFLRDTPALDPGIGH